MLLCLGGHGSLAPWLCCQKASQLQTTLGSTGPSPAYTLNVPLRSPGSHRALAGSAGEWKLAVAGEVDNHLVDTFYGGLAQPVRPSQLISSS